MQNEKLRPNKRISVVYPGFSKKEEDEGLLILSFFQMWPSSILILIQTGHPKFFILKSPFTLSIISSLKINKFNKKHTKNVCIFFWGGVGVNTKI